MGIFSEISAATIVSSTTIYHRSEFQKKKSPLLTSSVVVTTSGSIVRSSTMISWPGEGGKSRVFVIDFLAAGAIGRSRVESREDLKIRWKFELRTIYNESDETENLFQILREQF